MDLVIVTKNKGIATVELNNKKVNSINGVLIEELFKCFENIENDDEINAVILTGRGKFFSFGFDIPEFIDWPKDDFKRFIIKFTDFYTYLFLFPKPVIAAINGHAIAGGCMIITACDYRIMVSGKAKISLNEITFGSTVIAGSVELLKYCAGQNNAEKILFGGKMYNAKEAQKLGLIDEISKEEEFLKKVQLIAIEYSKRNIPAFTSIKRLLRKSVQDEMIRKEKRSIQEFIDIWYSQETRKKLKQIKIY